MTIDIANLDALYRPRSVAIVGASNQARKWGSVLLRNVIAGGYGGPIYPVTPRGGDVAGLPSYPTLADTPEVADLVFVTIAAPLAIDAVTQAAERGTRVAVICSSGFAEAGGDGGRLQAELLAQASRGGVRVVGPNCMGVYSSLGPVYASMALEPDFSPGDVAVVSQSGNVGAALYQAGNRQGVRWHSFVSVGNQADVTFADYVSYLSQDATCRVICCYVEGTRALGDFFEAVTAATASGRPVLVLRGGVSAPGSRAAISHTGSLTGDSRVFASLLAQAGGQLMGDYGETVSTAHYLSRHEARRVRKVMILTDGGGFGVLAADAVASVGLELPPTSPSIIERLDGLLAPYSARGNPVDIGGDTDSDPTLWLRAAEVCIAEPAADALLVTGALGIYGRAYDGSLDEAESIVGERLAQVEHDATIPMIVQSLCARDGSTPMRALVRTGVTLVEQIPLAARILATADSIAAAKERLTAASDVDSVGSPSVAAIEGHPANEHDLMSALASRGVVVPATDVASDVDGAVAAAVRIGLPVVVKVLADDLEHKSDLGGVVTDLHSTEAVRAAAQRVLSISGRVLIARQVAAGPELICSFLRHDEVGPLVMIGIGGVLADAVDEVVIVSVPADRASIDAAIGRSLAIRRLIARAEGSRHVDRDAVITLMERVAAIGLSAPDLRQLELNPVRDTPDGLVALDAKATWSRSTGASPDASPGSPADGSPGDSPGASSNEQRSTHAHRT